MTIAASNPEARQRSLERHRAANKASRLRMGEAERRRQRDLMRRRRRDPSVRAAEREDRRNSYRRDLQRSREAGRRSQMRRFHALKRGMDAETELFCATVLIHDPCSYCGKGPGRDHIIPLSAGGECDWTNLTSCCKRCNNSKRAFPMLLWLLERTP